MARNFLGETLEIVARASKWGNLRDLSLPRGEGVGESEHGDLGRPGRVTRHCTIQRNSPEKSSPRHRIFQAPRQDFRTERPVASMATSDGSGVTCLSVDDLKIVTGGRSGQIEVDSPFSLSMLARRSLALSCTLSCALPRALCLFLTLSLSFQ